MRFPRAQSFDERVQTLFASRRQGVFRECRLDNADLRGVRRGQARFERSNFAGANIDGWLSACASSWSAEASLLSVLFVKRHRCPGPALAGVRQLRRHRSHPPARHPRDASAGGFCL
jgi:hypothetical protein